MLLVALIVASLIFYVYFKVQQAKGKGPMEKRWYSAKGNVAIGIFFISFGTNSYIGLSSQVAAYVALLFVSFGLVNVVLGLKHYRTFLPLARKEVEEVKHFNHVGHK